MCSLYCDTSTLYTSNPGGLIGTDSGKQGFRCWVLVLLFSTVGPSFAIILMVKRKLVAFL